REAAELAATTDSVSQHAQTLLAYAEVLLLRGSREKAVEAVEEAVALLEAKGNAAAGTQARALLAWPLSRSTENPSPGLPCGFMKRSSHRVTGRCRRSRQARPQARPLRALRASWLRSVAGEKWPFAASSSPPSLRRSRNRR